jgi:outer membrane protein assembly factor BamB
MAVADSAGIVYAAFDAVAEAATGVGRPGVLMAVDPVAKAALWTRTGPRAVLTGLASGVLAWENGRITAFDAAGGVRWTRPVAGGVSPAGTAFDPARGRVYLGGDRFRGVMALDAATGDLIWRTRARDRADLLSVGRSGRVYVAIHRPGRRAVRAVRLTNGSAVWERRTRMPVLGAHELANGTVAVSAGTVYTANGRVTLLRPRGR